MKKKLKIGDEEKNNSGTIAVIIYAQTCYRHNASPKIHRYLASPLSSVLSSVANMLAKLEYYYPSRM
jgi:hypothetical protein